jgi:DNA-nicking Smr family endonuclease
MGKSRKPSPIRIVNLEEGMPLVHEALTKLDRELALARQQRCPLVKLIHGYGSSGSGGDIRIAVQKRLRELQEQSAVRAYIFGEDWSPSDAQTWALLKSQPALKTDSDLGKRNLGITIVVL